jgi:hypothetical protein
MITIPKIWIEETASGFTDNLHSDMTTRPNDDQIM